MFHKSKKKGNGSQNWRHWVWYDYSFRIKKLFFLAISIERTSSFYATDLIEMCLFFLPIFASPRRTFSQSLPVRSSVRIYAYAANECHSFAFSAFKQLFVWVYMLVQCMFMNVCVNESIYGYTEAWVHSQL